MATFLMNALLCAMVAANLVAALRSKNERSRNIHFLVAGFGLGQMVAILEYLNACG